MSVDYLIRYERWLTDPLHVGLDANSIPAGEEVLQCLGLLSTLNLNAADSITTCREMHSILLKEPRKAELIFQWGGVTCLMKLISHFMAHIMLTATATELLLLIVSTSIYARDQLGSIIFAPTLRSLLQNYLNHHTSTGDGQSSVDAHAYYILLHLCQLIKLVGGSFPRDQDGEHRHIPGVLEQVRNSARDARLKAEALAALDVMKGLNPQTGLDHPIVLDFKNMSSLILQAETITGNVGCNLDDLGDKFEDLQIYESLFHAMPNHDKPYLWMDYVFGVFQHSNLPPHMWNAWVNGPNSFRVLEVLIILCSGCRGMRELMALGVRAMGNFALGNSKLAAWLGMTALGPLIYICRLDKQHSTACMWTLGTILEMRPTCIHSFRALGGLAMICHLLTEKIGDTLEMQTLAVRIMAIMCRDNPMIQCAVCTDFEVVPQIVGMMLSPKPCQQLMQQVTWLFSELTKEYSNCTYLQSAGVDATLPDILRAFPDDHVIQSNGFKALRKLNSAVSSGRVSSSSGSSNGFPSHPMGNQGFSTYTGPKLRSNSGSVNSNPGLDVLINHPPNAMPWNSLPATGVNEAIIGSGIISWSGPQGRKPLSANAHASAMALWEHEKKMSALEEQRWQRLQQLQAQIEVKTIGLAMQKSVPPQPKPRPVQYGAKTHKSVFVEKKINQWMIKMERAAAKIQALWRGYRLRKRLTKVVRQFQSAEKIAREMLMGAHYREWIEILDQAASHSSSRVQFLAGKPGTTEYNSMVEQRKAAIVSRESTAFNHPTSYAQRQAVIVSRESSPSSHPKLHHGPFGPPLRGRPSLPPLPDGCVTPERPQPRAVETDDRMSPPRSRTERVPAFDIGVSDHPLSMREEVFQTTRRMSTEFPMPRDIRAGSGFASPKRASSRASSGEFNPNQDVIRGQAKSSISVDVGPIGHPLCPETPVKATHRWGRDHESPSPRFPQLRHLMGSESRDTSPEAVQKIPSPSSVKTTHTWGLHRADKGRAMSPILSVPRKLKEPPGSAPGCTNGNGLFPEPRNRLPSYLEADMHFPQKDIPITELKATHTWGQARNSMDERMGHEMDSFPMPKHMKGPASPPRTRPVREAGSELGRVDSCFGFPKAASADSKDDFFKTLPTLVAGDLGRRVQTTTTS